MKEDKRHPEVIIGSHTRMEKESYEYYQNALETGEHIAYLVYDNGTLIGAGGVSCYQVI